ncbi:aldo/keto reductase [Wenxinia saemankumensis]|uniref:2,5-diketo-D-gluconate reductase A n=1 Tax=Wenxinia saemankumensis TaxID=1447782 RepID=A0A1M6EJE1_9RHOB|nr:aldo/keto reductase [Wenxinia saemankumensis]SHI85607.1 2,5-diketo-D-gluconate reductase A [Wenxinia saemankumensis]
MRFDRPTLEFNDGHTIPRLGYGLWQVKEAEKMTEAAIGHGFRLIDGAAAYQNEEGMGRGIARSGVAREELFVTTKVPNDQQGRQKAKDCLRGSLDRLGLDRVDLVLIHWPAPKNDLYLETWEAFIELQEEGLATSIGVSNFEEEHLRRIIEATGMTPALNQIELHPGLAQEHMRRIDEELSIVTQSWSPLGRGASMEAGPVTAIAERLDASPAQVILAWNLKLGNSVLTRTENPDRLTENLAAMELDLTDEDMRALAALDTGDRQGPHPDDNN